MKTLIPLIVLVFFGLSFAASSVFAFGDCAGKAKGPATKITETAPPTRPPQPARRNERLFCRRHGVRFAEFCLGRYSQQRRGTVRSEPVTPKLQTWRRARGGSAHKPFMLQDAAADAC